MGEATTREQGEHAMVNTCDVTSARPSDTLGWVKGLISTVVEIGTWEHRVTGDPLYPILVDGVSVGTVTALVTGVDYPSGGELLVKVGLFDDKRQSMKVAPELVLAELVCECDAQHRAEGVRAELLLNCGPAPRRVPVCAKCGERMLRDRP